MHDEQSRWDEASRKLAGAQELTDDVRSAVEKFLTRQIGDPRGCRGFLGSAPGYPDRSAVVDAVDKIWQGLAALYRVDPATCEVNWVSGRPFVSDGDSQWLIGGDVMPSDES